MFTNIWNKAKVHITKNVTALIIIGVVFTLITVVLLPHEKKVTEELTKKFNDISQQYDEKTGDYKNTEDVAKLQSEATQIQSDNIIVKMIKIIVLAAFLGTIISLLAWLMQWLFTTIDFTKKTGNIIAPDGDRMRVLTAALYSATIIVSVVTWIVLSA
jgi:uncharacterized membrane protein (DUF106 family)